MLRIKFALLMCIVFVGSDAVADERPTFEALPDWVALPIHPAGMDMCVPSVGKKVVLSHLYGTYWPSNDRNGLTGDQLDKLSWDELSNISYVKTGGTVVNVSGEIIEFLEWRGVAISRVLEVDANDLVFSNGLIDGWKAQGYYEFEDDEKYNYLPWRLWRHAKGRFVPYEPGGRILAFEDQRFVDKDCYPIGTESHEGCYGGYDAHGLLSYSYDGEVISVNTVTSCSVD